MGAQGLHLTHPKHVRAARAALCTEAELTFLADTFQILANPTRLQIVCALAPRELCVGDLAAAVQMRLVRHRREGKLTFYSLADEHVAQLLDLGLEHVREELE
jgi:DNA-binding transcriptional ArsR family regulator